MTDARFEDAGDRPLRLVAETPEDLDVISALLQDAVFPVGEIRWTAKRRELALLLNRFRWEDQDRAERGKRGYERVRTVLLIRQVLGVSSQGVDRSDQDMVLSLLSLRFEPGDAPPAGRLVLTLAGDGALRCTVDCLEVIAQDVTRPYLAPSGRVPAHPAD